MNGLMMDWPLVIPEHSAPGRAVLPGEGDRQPPGRRIDRALELWRSREAGSSPHERACGNWA